MNEELQQLEQELGALVPSRVPSRLLDRIEAGVAALPDPMVAKVVPFPGTNRPVARARRGSGWLAAAAAVALLGGVAALYLPTGRQPAAAVASDQGTGAQRPAASAPAVAAPGFVTAGTRAGVREVRDEGVIWTGGREPLRRVRVVYFERVTLVNGRGEKLEVERPRVEYILLPEKLH